MSTSEFNFLIPHSDSPSPLPSSLSLQSKRYALIIKCIEDEIQGIARDQQRVIATMKKHLYMTTKDGHPPLTMTDEYGNQIIRSYLDMHRAGIGGLALQASGFVQPRSTEKELIRNYDLLTDLQLFMRPTTVIERLPLSPQKPPGSRPSSQPNPNLVSESRRKFFAVLKASKPVKVRADSESDGEEVQFLSEGGPGIPQPADEKQEQTEASKRARGRPRKSRLGLLNGGSACSTRANSPEVVTMPWVDLPDEPEETNDYDQPGFMLRLGLFTLELATKMKNRRPERRRRTVQSTEKTDFHYGQLEMVSGGERGGGQRGGWGSNRWFLFRRTRTEWKLWPGTRSHRNNICPRRRSRSADRMTAVHRPRLRMRIRRALVRVRAQGTVSGKREKIYLIY